MFNSPNAKAYMAGVIPAAVFVLAWVSAKFFAVEVPDEVQAALAVVLSPLAVYITPNA